jgi:hypothetical protein
VGVATSIFVMETLSDELLLLVFQLRDNLPLPLSSKSRGASLILSVAVCETGKWVGRVPCGVLRPCVAGGTR